ncbi:unnamed protein product [Adineta steineri]|uniref:Uncharacterized protein n=1 Tax=Adineta steineri TaxID=433720 RepID=A0A819PEK3_9BILA|nr:unnamed protein product [Adineta steineri]
MASGARIVSRLFVEENGAFDDVQVDKHEDTQKEAFTEEINNEVANSSMDLLTYQTNMERILQWIATLEENYGNQDKTLSNDLNIIKEQFQNHEDFILTLNKDENQVDDILSQVNQLLTSTDIHLQTQEENEIKEQIRILNEKWTLLRSKSLDRQSILHKTIMKLQTDQMESFATWLSQIEERISTNLEVMEDSIPGIYRQYHQFVQLQDELIVQQEISQSLENFIIAVDQEYDSTEIENKLFDCSKRWEYICNFVQQHWNVKITYILYDDDHFKEFIQTGNNITEQLKDADEDSTEHEFALKTLENRWQELHKQILKCEQDIEQSKFSNDLSEYVTRF